MGDTRAQLAEPDEIARLHGAISIQPNPDGAFSFESDAVKIDGTYKSVHDLRLALKKLLEELGE